jgi:hypothetical protein
MHNYYGLRTMTDNIGFCAVHFKDTDEFTRWPIKRQWRPVGKTTLAKVTDLAIQDLAAGQDSQANTQNDLITSYLIKHVVDAAYRKDLDVIPCRSYALMKHLNSNCFIIEAIGDRPGQLRSLGTRSWKKADRIIDEMEACMGKRRCTSGLRDSGSSSPHRLIQPVRCSWRERFRRRYSTSKINFGVFFAGRASVICWPRWPVKQGDPHREWASQGAA